MATQPRIHPGLVAVMTKEMVDAQALRAPRGTGKRQDLVAVELRRRGHTAVEEAATDVIAQQQARGIEEPWLRDDFVDLIVGLQLCS